MAADQPSREKAELLLAQAEKLTDIRAPGNHPFRLAAHITVYWDGGKTSEATYILLWNSPCSWRDELKFADFTQLRVAVDDKLFVVRTPNDLLPEVFRLSALLDFPNLLRPSVEAKAEYLKDVNKKGSAEEVIGLESSGVFVKTVDHLNRTSGVPVRVQRINSAMEYTFEDYADFGDYQFPRTLVAYRSGKVESKVRVEKLEESITDPSLLVALPNARVFSWCPHPQRAKPKGLEELNSFIRPIRGLSASPVAFYGVIGTDGKWHDLTVVRSAGKGTDSYSYWQNLLLEQNFTPARCGDTPIEQESVLDLRAH